MREKIDLPGFHDPAQIGIRCNGRILLGFMVRQCNKRQILAIGKARPSFNPILDFRREFGVAREGKNHKVRVGGRARSQLEVSPVAEHGKAPHEVAEYEVSVKSASQFLVEIPGAPSAVKVFVDEYNIERWPSVHPGVAGCVAYKCSVLHKVTLLVWRGAANRRKAPTAIGAATRALGDFPSLRSNFGGRVGGQSKRSNVRRRRSARCSFSP